MRKKLSPHPMSRTSRLVLLAFKDEEHIDHAMVDAVGGGVQTLQGLTRRGYLEKHQRPDNGGTFWSVTEKGRETAKQVFLS